MAARGGRQGSKKDVKSDGDDATMNVKMMLAVENVSKRTFCDEMMKM